MARACRHFSISRRAFYQAGHRHQRRDAADSTALALVSDCRARQPRLGTRKLHHLIEPKLQAAGRVADITYLPTDGNIVYLSLVTDVWSRKIVGWSVNETLQTEHTAQALEMALKWRKTRQRLIHHSDRGIQYCSDNYQTIHTKHGLTCSMTDGYDCYQNALAERINGILKGEFLLRRPRDLGQARQMVAEAVEIYNAERPHLPLKMQTPDAVHRASLAA